MAETVVLMGEGGASFEFELPLAEPYAEQVRKGRLKAADDDSAEALAASGIWGEPAGAEAGQPKARASRAAWAAHAESLGLEVDEAMTKKEIIALVEASEA